jgi:hypothetical protein
MTDTKTKTYANWTDRDKREQYRSAIQMSADVIEDRLEEDPHGRDVSELVFNEIDSSQWIIYNARNLAVLRFADNEPTEWQAFVEDGAHWRDVIQAMAFTAMRMDLYGECRERDLL